MMRDIKNTNAVLQQQELKAKLNENTNTNTNTNININVTVEIAQNKSSYHISKNNGRIRIKKTSENKQPFSMKTFWKRIKQIYTDWKECRNIKQQIKLNTDNTTLQK